uniref:Gingipain domain-containing protein n=1 Tax=candidate division WOR-3 bacterium TaxID=2052148 RepID=A0A7C3N683_UNCW3
MENIKRNLLSYFIWFGFLIFLFFPTISYGEEIKPKFSLKEEYGYLRILSDYQLVSQKEGFPQIPVIRKISVDKLFKVEVLKEESIKLSERLMPIPKPISKNEKFKMELNPDERIYKEKNRLIGKDFSFNNGVLEIYPFDYIPSENILIVKTIDVLYETKKYDKSLNRKVLIVYDSIFKTDTLSLKIFYLVRGYQPKFAEESVIGSTSTDIKNFIKTEYSSQPFSFLLLLGSSSMIPLEYGSGDNFAPTDLYYSLLDSLDYFPDIIISRLPFSDSLSLKNYLDNYNNYLFEEDIYRTPSAYFIATDDGGYHSLVESTHTYSMGVLRSVNFVCDSFFAYYQTGTRIDSAINKGKDIVVYSGHGATYYWAGPTFYDSDIENLTNTIYPDIFSFACLTGNYSYTNFFGNSWLSKNSKGSLTFVGSSVETYWNEDDVLQRYFIDSLKNSGYLFDIFNKAKKSYFGYFGDNSLTKGYFERYNFFSTPERFLGNRSIYNFSKDFDRYIPYNKLLDVSINFDGSLDSPIFLSLFKNNSLIDSNFVNAPSTIYLNTSSIVGDTLSLYTFIEGRKLFCDTAIVIGSGQFVTLKEYFLTDYYLDTFFFDLTFKNYGDTTSTNSRVFFKTNSTNFEIISDTLNIPSLESESIFKFEKGLVLKINDFSDSLITDICSVFTVSGTDTIKSIIPLNIMTPDFSMNFLYSLYQNDTLDGIPKNLYSKIYFKVNNNSLLQVKDLKISVTSKDIYIENGNFTIASLMPKSSTVIGFDVYTSSTLSKVCKVNITIKMGDWEKVIEQTLPLVYIQKPQYYGPFKGYYIYTNSMDYLENSPKFKDYNLDSFNFKQLNTKDDTTLLIKLPFKFKFFGMERDSIYLNTNGIISFTKLDNELFTPSVLPSEYLSQINSVVFCWADFRPSYYYDNFIKRSETYNNIFTYFDTINFSYIIYFNRVKSPDYLENTFIVSIDTTSITVYFKNIPQQNRFISGLQFADFTSFSLTGDSFVDINGESLIKNGVALKFTKEKPKLKSKFFDLDKEDSKKVSVDVEIIPKENLFYLNVKKSGIYSVEIYDLLGRKKSVFKNSLLSANIYRLDLKLESDGVKFILVKDISGKVLERKKIIFLK